MQFVGAECDSWSVKNQVNQPVPSELRLVELSVAAMKHAREQHNAAAALLLAPSQWSTAAAIAALGLEEVGKSHLCMSALNLPADLREQEAGAFWKMFNNHTVKAAMGQIASAVYLSEQPPPSLEALWEQAAEVAGRINNTKFRGLDVDVDDEGALSEPAAVTTEAEAREVVDMLGAVLDGLREMDLSFEMLDDPADFLAFLHEFNQGGGIYALLSQVDSAADVARMLGEFRAVVRGEAPEPEWLRTMTANGLPAGPQPMVSGF